MNKEQSTNTIYNCLTKDFWTQRKCSACQKFFTSTDYQTKNYQLSFLEALTMRTDIDNCLEVIFQPQHQQCPLTCGFNYQKEIFCYQEIKK